MLENVNDYLSLIYLILICLALFGLTFLFSRYLYLKTISQNKGKKKKKIADESFLSKKFNLLNKRTFFIYLKRELNLLKSHPSLLISSLISTVTIAISLIITGIFTAKSFTQAGNDFQQQNLFFLIVHILVLESIFNPLIGFSALSLEGRNFLALKAMPLKKNQFLLAKALPSLTLSLFLSLISSTVFSISYQLSAIYIIALFLSTISKTTWKVAIFTNYENVSSVIWNFLYAIILLAITISFLFLIFINLLATSITTPISKLQNQMANIVSLDYIQIPKEEIKGSIEVEALADSFDKLLERIRSQTIKLKREEAEKHKSELRALQNQINPHFLYNTLDSIIYLIDKGENEKAEEMILALSKFFRISISRGKNIIPLSKEVEHAKNYLLIQKIRFGEKFNYSIDFDPQLNKYYTIKLILQPLVENAIVHGLKEMQGIGEISVKAYLSGDLIKIIIKDNGFGILPEKLEEIKKSLNDNKKQNGVGIKNVYQRLKLYYGNQADILIESELDVGTTITIIIPSQEALSDEEK